MISVSFSTPDECWFFWGQVGITIADYGLCPSSKAVACKHSGLIRLEQFEGVTLVRIIVANDQESVRKGVCAILDARQDDSHLDIDIAEAPTRLPSRGPPARYPAHRPDLVAERHS